MNTESLFKNSVRKSKREYEWTDGKRRKKNKGKCGGIGFPEVPRKIKLPVLVPQ